MKGKSHIGILGVKPHVLTEAAKHSKLRMHHALKHHHKLKKMIY